MKKTKFSQKQAERVAKHERERKAIRKIIHKDVAVAYRKVEPESRFSGLYAMLRRIIQSGHRNTVAARVLRVEVKQQEAARLRKEKLGKTNS